MNLATGIAIVNEAFKSQKWKFSMDDSIENRVTFNISFSTNGKTRTRCRVTVFDTGICDIEIVFPFCCPDEKQYELMFYLTEFNFSKRYATYRLDLENGEIQYSYSYDFNDSSTSTDFLRRFSAIENMESDEYLKIENICTVSDSTETDGALSSRESSERNKYKIKL